MNSTNNLYFKVIVFCILLLCKIEPLQATEISPLIGVGQELFNFDLIDVGNGRGALTYNPNMAGVSRIGINAYGFGVGYSFRGSTKDLDRAKGTTDFFDLQLNYQARNWGLDTFYQTYTGFYTESSTLQVFPKLKFQHYGVMGRYALEDNEFSVNGLLDQSENVRATAGKYYVVTGFRQHLMENDVTFLPPDYQNINSELESLRKLKATSFNLGLGAGKYWVSSNHYFVGALLDLIGTYALYTYENTSSTTNSSYATLSYNLKVGLGYSGETFKTGLSLTADTTTLKTPGASYLRTSAMRALIYLRFVF